MAAGSGSALTALHGPGPVPVAGSGRPGHRTWVPTALLWWQWAPPGVLVDQASVSDTGTTTVPLPLQ
jgi:hypothetical protein